MKTADNSYNGAENSQCSKSYLEKFQISFESLIFYDKKDLIKSNVTNNFTYFTVTDFSISWRLKALSFICVAFIMTMETFSDFNDLNRCAKCRRNVNQ